LDSDPDALDPNALGPDPKAEGALEALSVFDSAAFAPNALAPNGLLVEAPPNAEGCPNADLGAVLLPESCDDPAPPPKILPALVASVPELVPALNGDASDPPVFDEGAGKPKVGGFGASDAPGAGVAVGVAFFGVEKLKSGAGVVELEPAPVALLLCSPAGLGVLGLNADIGLGAVGLELGAPNGEAPRAPFKEEGVGVDAGGAGDVDLFALLTPKLNFNPPEGAVEL